MKRSKKENATNKLQNKQKTFQKGVCINKATTSSSDKNIFDNLQFSSEESSDSLLMDNITITVHPPIDTKWKKSKCRIFKLTFISGIIFENLPKVKNIELYQLVPCRIN